MIRKYNLIYLKFLQINDLQIVHFLIFFNVNALKS